MLTALIVVIALACLPLILDLLGAAFLIAVAILAVTPRWVTIVGFLTLMWVAC